MCYEIVEKFLIVDISKEGIAVPGAEVGMSQILAKLCSWPQSSASSSLFLLSFAAINGWT